MFRVQARDNRTIFFVECILKPSEKLEDVSWCIINAVYKYWHLPPNLDIKSEIMLLNVLDCNIMDSDFAESVVGESYGYAHHITVDFSPLGWEIIYKYDSTLKTSMIEHDNSQPVDIRINYPECKRFLDTGFYILLNNDVKIQDIIDTSMKLAYSEYGEALYAIQIKLRGIILDPTISIHELLKNPELFSSNPYNKKYHWKFDIDAEHMGG
jgi:hypothetical protein